MLRLGYRPRFSVGVVAGSSVLGMLIPPSLLLIVFGISGGTVDRGPVYRRHPSRDLVLAVAYCVLIWVMATYFPDKVGTPEALNTKREATMTGGEAARKKACRYVLLIALVLGGIYGGMFTATEAGGVGALGALVLALAKRALNRSQVVGGADRNRPRHRGDLLSCWCRRIFIPG